MATSFDMNALHLFLQLSSWLKNDLGVTYVLDAAVGGDIALLEAREEFCIRLGP